MPAKRLPWYKVWAEHTDHHKVCELSDAEYRTWHYLLAKASQQPIRWYFASLAHAAKVTGRPLKQVKSLLDYGLIEEGTTELTAGIWIHNAPKWQDKYPSDYSVNAAGTLLEYCHNVAMNAAGIPISEREGDTEKEKDTEPPRPIRSREGARKRGIRAAPTPLKACLEDSGFSVDEELVRWATTELAPPLRTTELANATEEFSEYWVERGDRKSLDGWRRTWRSKMRWLSERKERQGAA